MKSFHAILRLLLAAALAAAAACSSKSPTEPGSQPVNPKVPAPTPTYSVTVTANPGTLTVGSTTGSNINIKVVNIQDGTPPPDLTLVLLSTTLGLFSAPVGGSTSLSLPLVHGQAQAVLYAGTSTGTATLSATLSAGAGGQCSGCVGSGAGTVNIIAAGTFFLNNVAPNTGDPAGGTPVTISGGGFIAPVSVTFAGSNAPVVHVSPGAIQVLTPPSASPVPVGSTLQVSVSVTNNLGGTTQANATLSNAFTYVPGGGGIQQPQVFSVTPASGPDDGGTQVSIIGQGFVSPVQVFFGSGGSAATFSGVEATVQSVTAQKIIVVSPPARGFGQDNTNQLVNILVKNLASGFATVDTAAFKYGSKVLVTSAGPTQTPFNQQVKVTIFGQGFQDPVAVSLAGVAAQVLSTSGTELQVLSSQPQVVSCANVAGPIHVTNINNGDSGDGPTFTYLVSKPTVVSVNPSISAPGGPATQVVLTGSNFNPASDVVQVGNLTASVNVGASSSGSLVVTLPAFVGAFPTVACIGAGGASGTMEVGSPANIVVTDAQTSCSSTLQGGFTYEPADTSCHVPVTPPPAVPKASFTFVPPAHGSFTVAFTDTSSNSPTSWQWNFMDPPNGTEDKQQNPVHTFPTGPSKTYFVSLVACNAAGCSQPSPAQPVTVPGP
jgi:PKD repeat protein